MLQHIRLQNLAIIESLDLDLAEGMTVLTGETGAGKSIIIDAIELAIGERADSKIVREGQDRCEISLSFDVKNCEEAQEWLKIHELESHDECIIRRIITQEGRSRGYINGQASPLQMLSELGNILVNIHSQHQHQSLLKRDRQRQLLDAYADHPSLCDEIKNLYQAWSALQKQLAKLQKPQGDNSNASALLYYQLEELQKLGLMAGELSALEEEHKKLANAEHLLENCQAAQSLLSENEGSAQSQLHQSQRLLEEISSMAPTLHPISMLLKDAGIHIQEAITELRHYFDTIQLNPERLQWVEQRLSDIHTLARKHNTPATALLMLQQRLQQDLQAFQHSEMEVTQLQEKLLATEKTYYLAAAKLRVSRHKAAKAFTEQVIQNMHQLSMAGGEFAINFIDHKTTQPAPAGSETVEFQVSTNSGMSLQPLSKIISGGELSRISLAIQVITAQKITTPILIFDEVDVGIGGGTAEIVGRLLRKLGNSVQVLCVTHLPQVAVQAHHHLRVEKTNRNDHTITEIRTLKGEEKIAEIARMLGGVKITSQTRAHAKEMLLSVNE